MVSSADAERLRQSQIGVRALVERDLDRMWDRIWSQIPSGPTQAANVRDAFMQQLPVLVNRYGEMSAAIAADWYESQRTAAGVGGAFTASLKPSPYLDAVEGTVRRTAAALWSPRPEDMLYGMRASTGKYVLAAGRETIARATDADPRATGWQRIVRTGACDFCTMLHGRGGVYKRDTVHFAAHKECNCAAAPTWDQDAPEVDVKVYEASKRTSGFTPEEREQHNAAIRSYLSGN